MAVGVGRSLQHPPPLNHQLHPPNPQLQNPISLFPTISLHISPQKVNLGVELAFASGASGFSRVPMLDCCLCSTRGLRAVGCLLQTCCRRPAAVVAALDSPGQTQGNVGHCTPSAAVVLATQGQTPQTCPKSVTISTQQLTREEQTAFVYTLSYERFPICLLVAATQPIESSSKAFHTGGSYYRSARTQIL